MISPDLAGSRREVISSRKPALSASGGLKGFRAAFELDQPVTESLVYTVVAVQCGYTVGFGHRGIVKDRIDEIQQRVGISRL